MAQVTFQGSPISTNGNLPATGQVAPDFCAFLPIYRLHKPVSAAQKVWKM